MKAPDKGHKGKGRPRVGVTNGQRLRRRVTAAEKHARQDAEASGYPLHLIVREPIFFDPFEFTEETEHSRLIHHAFNSPKDRSNGSGPIPARAV